MNADVIIALMTKLEFLFGVSRNSFLAFQIPALPISPHDLDFRSTQGESGMTPQEALRAASDFSRLTNLIPEPSNRWLSDGRFLWNEYETILNMAIVADSVQTPKDKAELQKAKKLLYRCKKITDKVGTRTILVDSPKYSAYKQYQKAYLDAMQQYNALKLSAENSNDPKVKEKWKLEEPRYKAAFENAKADWVGKGFKEEIEDAIADIDRITGGNYQIAWADWKREFKQSILTDLDNQDFYETHFMPANFFKNNSHTQWTKLTLDASEINALSLKSTESTSQLISGLISLGVTQASDIEISHLSLELARVEIMRNWLNPSVFISRFWKWGDAREPLSDGHEPPQGSLPAYTTSMVFARNLKIDIKPDSKPNKEIIEKLQNGKLILLGPFVLKGIKSNIDPLSVSRLYSAPLSPVSLKQVINRKATLPGPSRGGKPTERTIQSPIEPIPITDDQSKESEGLQLIAFICQKVPKSPDPDPSLPFS